jgi:hypothetical protein
LKKDSMLRKVPAMVLMTATATLQLSGCGLASQQLHVSDDSHAVISARVVKRLGTGPGGPGIELEASRAEAKGSQVIPANSNVSLGGQLISGPATLQHRAQVASGHLVYNHLLFAGHPVELEWFAGGAWGRLRWESTSSVPTATALRARASWYGPTGGALGRLHVAQALCVELRYAGAMALSGAVDTSSNTQVEAALAYRPTGGVVLRGGFAELRNVTRPEAGASELSVRARGPFLNLGLEF